MGYSKYYTVYDNRTEKVKAFGTSEECRKMLKFKNLRYFYTFVCKAKSGKIKGSRVVVENLNGDNDNLGD